MKNNYAKLGDLELRVIESISLSHNNSVSKRRIESGYDINDHIMINPASVSLTVVENGEKAFDNKMKLQNMALTRKTYEFTMDKLGEFKMMVISSLSFSESHKQSNGFTATIKLQEVRTNDSGEGKGSLAIYLPKRTKNAKEKDLGGS